MLETKSFLVQTLDQTKECTYLLEVFNQTLVKVILLKQHASPLVCFLLHCFCQYSLH